MSFDEAFEIASPSGAVLSARLSLAASQPKALVHINHGLAEHSARYHRFAEQLNAEGFAVVAHDHRGHGQTKAPDAPRGVFSSRADGVGLVMDDCAAVQAYARAKPATCH